MNSHLVCVAVGALSALVMSMAAPATRAATPTATAAALDALASDDPMSLLRLARERCRTEISDYRCVFTKQERIEGRLRRPTVLDVQCRQRPLSVMMTVQGQPQTIKRALYVRGARVNRHGREMMLVEPAGWRRMLASQAEVAVDDRRVLAHNRNTIDKFGFQAMLDRLIGDCRRAAAAGDLDLRYAGNSEIDDRPTMVLVRRLPFGGGDDRYPSAVTVIHLDREWLLPVSVESYADVDRHTLLASYVLTRVHLNPGYGDDTFKF